MGLFVFEQQANEGHSTVYFYRINKIILGVPNINDIMKLIYISFHGMTMLK